MTILNPNAIPCPTLLERRSIALATLDAILSPDWTFRYFSFNARWDNDGQRLASMRDSYIALKGLPTQFDQDFC